MADQRKAKKNYCNVLELFICHLHVVVFLYKYILYNRTYNVQNFVIMPN